MINVFYIYIYFDIFTDIEFDTYFGKVVFSLLEFGSWQPVGRLLQSYLTGLKKTDEKYLLTKGIPQTAIVAPPFWRFLGPLCAKNESNFDFGNEFLTVTMGIVQTLFLFCILMEIMIKIRRLCKLRI